jgi:hypothetical protein
MLLNNVGLAAWTAKDDHLPGKKPHDRGIINRINFMPWRGQTSCFVTSGSDHAVVLWKEDEKNWCWGQESLHMNHHTSAVMAAFGFQYKEAVLSVGLDKSVVLFDLMRGSTDLKFQLDSKCLNALPSQLQIVFSPSWVCIFAILCSLLFYAASIFLRVSFAFYIRFF